MLETSSTSTAEIIAFPSRHLPEGHGLFLGSATTPANTGIVGLVVKMAHRPCGACGGIHFIITPPVAMHHAGLRCVACDQHNGWLSKGAVTFIQMTVAKLGRPTEALNFYRREQR